MLTSGEVARPTAQDIVARDANPPHTVMKSLERRMFELRQPLWNDPTEPGQRTCQWPLQSYI
jgi:hypothetical protein